jgi:hypothetical protein
LLESLIIPDSFSSAQPFAVFISRSKIKFFPGPMITAGAGKIFVILA